MTEPDDEERIEEVGRRASTGFEAEALRNLDALHAVALALTGSREQAGDLVSDAIREAARRWEVHRLGTSPRVWLMELLHQSFASRARASTVRASRVPDETAGDAPASGYDSIPGDEIRKAIGILPIEYRTAVVFRDLRGLSYAELARVLGVPERTAVSRLHRGRRMLQLALSEKPAGEPKPAVR